MLNDLNRVVDLQRKEMKTMREALLAEMALVQEKFQEKLTATKVDLTLCKLVVNQVVMNVQVAL